MKNLITPEQVISLAFGDGDYISAEVVTEVVETKKRKFGRK